MFEKNNNMLITLTCILYVEYIWQMKEKSDLPETEKENNKLLLFYIEKEQ